MCQRGSFCFLRGPTMLLKYSSEANDPLFRSRGPLRVVRVELRSEEAMSVPQCSLRSHQHHFRQSTAALEPLFFRDSCLQVCDEIHASEVSGR